MTNHASAAEDISTKIASSVRERGLAVEAQGRFLFITGNHVYIRLGCPDTSQASRLAAMMRAPTPVFDAMNLPETPAFPSVRGKV